MIDTTDNSNDTENRAAVILLNPDRTKFLVGHAPNKSWRLPNQWDLVGKGHIEKTENAIDTIQRELFEESNIDCTDLEKTFIGTVAYQKGLLSLYVVILPDLNVDIKCQSCFTDNFGKKRPEFTKFEWIDFSQYKQYLYKSLVKAFDTLDIVNTIQKMTTDGIL